MEVYEVMKKNQYGQYLKEVMERQVSGTSVLIKEETTMKETIDLLGKILTNILTALYEPF